MNFKKAYKVMIHWPFKSNQNGYEVMVYDEKYKGLHCKIPEDTLIGVAATLEQAGRMIKLEMEGEFYGHPPRNYFYLQEILVPDDTDVEKFCDHLLN